ncbi:MAG: ATP-grasp domain-containing protein [Chloroflexota bacterium]
MRSNLEIILIESYTRKPWRSLETYQLIEQSLKEEWRVHSINAFKRLDLTSNINKLRLERRKKLFVFNIAEYLDEENKVGFLPGILDEIGLPHLGSSGETVEIGLDKAATKKLLSDQGIPTPRFFVVKDKTFQTSAEAKKIGFPLIVKPVNEGGHIGIREDSVVYDEIALNKIIQRIHEEHDQPALVEEFITGPEMRECSVGIIDGETRLFTPIEIDYEAMAANKEILSYESAQQDLEKTKLVQEGKLRKKMIDLAERTFEILGAKDYSRVDLRMNGLDCYVLEINIMPGLGPKSFLPQAAKEIYGLEYAELIQMMVKHSMGRQKK